MISYIDEQKITSLVGNEKSLNKLIFLVVSKWKTIKLESVCSSKSFKLLYFLPFFLTIEESSPFKLLNIKKCYINIFLFCFFIFIVSSNEFSLTANILYWAN
jgi:hypothetical protein